MHPGDKIHAEVFVKCTTPIVNSDPITGLAGLLTTAFGTKAVIDGVQIFNVTDNSGYTTFLNKDDVADEQPKAFLNYVLFDNDYKIIDFDADQATGAAEIPQTNPQLHQHEQLIFDLTIEKEGFLYIYVSNESKENMDVYFDDLRVNQTYSNIVAGGDFYPFGLSIKDREISREMYRFGYQGQFAEKDEETGWNHFELRDYDPSIGRWTSTDPYGQYWSPYTGMGNNPINSIDPNGGYTWLGAWIRSGFSSDIYQSGEDGGKPVWGYSDDDGHHFGDDAGSFWKSFDTSEGDAVLARHSEIYNTGYNSLELGNAIEPAYPESIFIPLPVKSLQASKSLFFTTNLAKAQVKGISGVYEITFQSGKRYVGKAFDLSQRAWRSANKQSKDHPNDPITHMEVHPMKNAKRDNNQLYKAENDLLQKDIGGHRNPNNYNQRSVPGYD